MVEAKEEGYYVGALLSELIFLYYQLKNSFAPTESQLYPNARRMQEREKKLRNKAWRMERDRSQLITSSFFSRQQLPLSIIQLPGGGGGGHCGSERGRFINLLFDRASSNKKLVSATPNSTTKISTSYVTTANILLLIDEQTTGSIFCALLTIPHLIKTATIPFYIGWRSCKRCESGELWRQWIGGEELSRRQTILCSYIMNDSEFIKRVIVRGS